jgi:DNA-binding transcriptional MerR regulator
MYQLSKELITAQEVEEFLESRDKTRYWFHNLGARYKLLPPPIIKPIITKSLKKGRINKYLPKNLVKEFSKLGGRVVLYPKQLLDLLDLIIKLKDNGLSFNEVKSDKDVQRKLKKLKYLVMTDLYAKDFDQYIGGLLNFKVARKFLIERKGLSQDKLYLDFLNQISKVLEDTYKKHNAINKQIRDYALAGKPISKDSEEEMKRLEFLVILSYKVMKLVTDIALDMIKKKEITIHDWLSAAQKIGEKREK